MCVRLDEQDIHLLARAGDTLLRDFLSWVPLHLDTLWFHFLCLLSLARFYRYQQSGGSADFGSYLEYFGKTLIKSVANQDTEAQRQRRSSGADQAAADKREQEKGEKQRQQVMKITGLASSKIDEAKKWANSDPNSLIIPHHTVRILRPPSCLILLSSLSGTSGQSDLSS